MSDTFYYFRIIASINHFFLSVLETKKRYVEDSSQEILMSYWVLILPLNQDPITKKKTEHKNAMKI